MMLNYERVVRDVRSKTKESAISWKVVLPGLYSKVLVNSERVLRAYRSAYLLADRNYELLFVERKIEHYDDLGDSFEGYGFELLVLGPDGEIVLTIYEGVVDRDELLRLASVIEEHNDRAKDFFSAFEQRDTA